MAREDRFTFVVSAEERKLIASLARRLQRSEGDAVRWVVMDFARALESDPAQPVTTSAQPQPQAAQR
jgi:hypothetical protein